SLLYSLCCSAPRHVHSFPTRRSSDLFEREYFSDYKEIDYHDEILTAKGLLKVHGIGTIKCKFWNGETWINGTLTNVKYVPDCDLDRKSTRLNSSHVSISYAVFCLKKK